MDRLEYLADVLTRAQDQPISALDELAARCVGRGPRRRSVTPRRHDFLGRTVTEW
jgi:hypothetical protein